MQDMPVHFDGDVLTHQQEAIIFPRLQLVRIGLAKATYTLLGLVPSKPGALAQHRNSPPHPRLCMILLYSIFI